MTRRIGIVLAVLASIGCESRSWIAETDDLVEAARICLNRYGTPFMYRVDTRQWQCTAIEPAGVTTWLTADVLNEAEGKGDTRRQRLERPINR